jgi:SynChlorMet cassette radical SAM/SPASM protein ScmF
MYQNKPISQSALNFDIFCTIINEAKPLGLTSVKLTGGEPLFHPKIFEILSFIQQEQLELIFESNGIAMTSDLASMIAGAINPSVAISLDGADASTHEWMRGVRGSFEKALQGICAIVDAGVKPQIIMTLMRRNVHQIEALVELAEQLGAQSVKLNVLQPIARGNSVSSKGENLPIKELVRLGSWIERDIAPTAPIPVIFSHPLAFRPLSRMFPDNYSCATCHIHRILGVLYDGSYALCGIGQTEPEMVFGYAGSEQLSELWACHPTLQKIRKGIPDLLQNPCRECMMKHLCLGCCVAQNFSASQDLFAPYWYCEEALRQGLFPVSRLIPSHNAH